MDPMVSQALQLMLYGLGGVFAALTVLFISVKVISKLFPHKDEES